MKTINIFLSLMFLFGTLATNAGTGGDMPYEDLINNGMPGIIGAGQVPDLYQFLPVPKPKPPITLGPVDLTNPIPQLPQQNVTQAEPPPAETPAATPPAAEAKPGKYPSDLKLGDVPHKENYAYWLSVVDNTPNKDITKEDADFIGNSQGARGTIFQGDATNRKITTKDRLTFLNNIAKKIPAAILAGDGDGFKNYLSPKEKNLWEKFTGGDPYEAMRMEGYLDAPKIAQARKGQLAAEAEAAKSNLDKILEKGGGAGTSWRESESGPVPGAYEAAMDVFKGIVADNKTLFDQYISSYNDLKTFREEQSAQDEQKYQKWADIYAGGEPQSFSQEKRDVPRGTGMNPITGYAGVIYEPSPMEPPLAEVPQRLPLPPIPQVATMTAESEYIKGGGGGGSTGEKAIQSIEIDPKTGKILKKEFTDVPASSIVKSAWNPPMADSAIEAYLGMRFKTPHTDRQFNDYTGKPEPGQKKVIHSITGIWNTLASQGELSPLSDLLTSDKMGIAKDKMIAGVELVYDGNPIGTIPSDYYTGANEVKYGTKFYLNPQNYWVKKAFTDKGIPNADASKLQLKWVYDPNAESRVASVVGKAVTQWVQANPSFDNIYLVPKGHSQYNQSINEFIQAMTDTIIQNRLGMNNPR